MSSHMIWGAKFVVSDDNHPKLKKFVLSGKDSELMVVDRAGSRQLCRQYHDGTGVITACISLVGIYG